LTFGNRFKISKTSKVNLHTNLKANNYKVGMFSHVTFFIDMGC